MSGFDARFLECTSCKETFGHARETHQYTDADSVEACLRDADSSEPPDYVLGDPIWCHACNRPGYRERIPDMPAFALALTVLKSPDGVTLPDGVQVDQDLLLIGRNWGLPALQRFGERLLNRRSAQQCLACGSRSFNPLGPPDTDSGLRHDGCGGRLVNRRIFFRGHSSSHGPWVVRYFGWDGRFKWAARYAMGADGQYRGEPVTVDRWE